PNATAYLHFSAGEPSANVLKLVDDSLRPELRTALFRAGQSGANVSLKNIAVQHEGGTRAVNVQVRPAALSGDLLGRSDGEAEKFFLIIFEDAGVAVPQTGEHVEQPHEEVTVHLENEIRQLRSQLNATVQQYEASTEELKASNEELQAMNEELRSATEELETSREELQSINEELTTVNAELKSNLDELSRANSDLQNLMASTDIGTIFLDRKLRVKRFTPRVQDLFNLIPGDIGRPLSDITNKINYPELMQHARHVLATLEKHSSEIQANGNWFVVRMAPYRSLDERIEGVVISFIDVTARREAEEALRESEEQFRRAIEDAPIPIIMHAEDGQVLQISRTWTELTGYSAEEMQSFDAWLNNAYGEGANALRAHMQELFKGGTRVTNIEFPIKTRGGEMRHWSFSASAPGTLRDGRRFIVGMALDITGRQESEQQLRESEQQLRESEQFVRSTLDSFSSMIAILDRNGVILDVNQSWKDFALENGYDSPNYGIGENYLKVTRRAADKGTLDAQRIGDGIEAILNGTSRAFEFEYPCHSPTAFRWFIVNVSPLSTAGGGAVIWHTDITARKQTEEALRESEGRFRQFAENSADVFWILDAKTRKVEYINPIYEKMFGQPRDRVMADRQKRLDVVVAEDREKASSGLQEALAGGTFVRNYRIQRASDGEQRWIRDTGFPIRNDGGEITRIAGVAQDVTGDKEQTAALNVTKERFELLVEEAKEYAMFLLDPSNVITYWSTGAERVFGWSAAEAVGQSGELIFTPEDRAREEEEKEIDVALRNGTAPDQRWHMRKDGTRIWVDGVMRRLDDEKTGALRGFAKIARDATSQREGEEQLRRAHEELERRVQERTAELQGANAKLHQAMEQRQMLEKQILRITEEERARISQDLHDSLCQELTATAFLLKSRAKAIAAQSRVAADSLTEAAETVNANAGLARDLARGFHPMELGASGLPSALRELCSHTNDHISCRCDCPRSLRLDENVAVNLYRIAQEAVTNSIKHAKANEIVISLERTNGELVLTVSDDGEGKRRRGRGLGTHIMQYRARAVGGTLRVESARGRGTSVTCRVPLRRTKT
ncbi:MAG: PAS domain S-box protein, partial [Verrucomicrobia bacterium]|nr:PAS domain S-box protein [Verrucomicrobiota bacterium]